MNVVLPELDGRLLTRAISFKAEMPVDPRLEFAVVRHAPIADRIDHVARLATAWVRLGRTKRQGRCLALMLSDYPARGGRTGPGGGPRRGGERRRDPQPPPRRGLRRRRSRRAGGRRRGPAQGRGRMPENPDGGLSRLAGGAAGEAATGPRRDVG